MLSAIISVFLFGKRFCLTLKSLLGMKFGKICAALLFVLHCVSAAADGWSPEEIAPHLREGRWPAHWIAVPGAAENTYGVYLFRKTFDLGEVPPQFKVYVSGDSRYKFYVNGRLAGLGPSAGDLYNWSFETLDLAPLLRPGRNTLAAVVWDFAERRPVAQMSSGKSAFLLQGADPVSAIVDTDASWRCMRNESYSPCEFSVLGYYAAGAGERMDARRCPWGWEQPSYDDAAWVRAEPLIEGALKGATDYPGRQLVPSPIPPMEMKPVRMARLRRAEGVEPPAGFPAREGAFTVPAHSCAELLLDNDVLMTGYPILRFSGGRDAEIEIGYAESLYDRQAVGEKGDRNAVEGKLFVGSADQVVADGGPAREYMPLWWRTWRYARLRITTAAEPLVVEDFRAVTSMYPFVRESRFEAPELTDAGRILETGWRTARLCANETYMDCPYYEQLQYFGDTRIQAMVTMYNTRNDELVRSALEHGRRSIVADGITMSRYPSSLHQFIPSFSLWWICMAHDYWRYRGDEAFLKRLLPGARSVLAWFERYLKPDGSLGRIPFWFFMDWSSPYYGEPAREADGNSAVQDLQYVLALDAAAGMERAFGLPVMAEHYEAVAAAVRARFGEKYWDDGRRLFADTHDKRSFSQHANVLAILAGAVRGEQATALFDRLEEDPDILPCTIYFRYYLQQAMAAAGRGDRLVDGLQLWRDQLALGLTTWAEQPEPSRSDCHAWGASPNIEFYRTLLGIDSDAPGFRRVRIAPALGGLHRASGAIPHPSGGEISVSYVRSKNGRLKARIALPEGVSGRLIWHGKEYPLAEGGQTIEAD